MPTEAEAGEEPLKQDHLVLLVLVPCVFLAHF